MGPNNYGIIPYFDNCGRINTLSVLCPFESINFKKKYRKWRFGYNSATVVEIKDPAKSIFWWNWTLIVGIKWKIPIQWLSVLAIMIISWFPIENCIYLLYLYRDFKNCFSTFIKISLCCCHQDTDTDDNCLSKTYLQIKIRNFGERKKKVLF